MNLEPYFSLKVNAKWTINLNVKYKTINFQKETKFGHFRDTELQYFRESTKPQAIK